MVALAASPGTVRCVATGTASGQPVVNVFHVYRTAAPTSENSQANVALIASAVATAYGAQFKPLLASEWSGDEVIAQDLSSPLAPSAQSGLTGTGTGSGANTPNSAACVISWKISRHYRGGHPRTYLGPLNSSRIESPTSLQAAYVTSVVAAATAFLSALATNANAAGPLQLCCLHRTLDGVTLPTPLRSNIISCAVDSRIDSMRRRLGPDR